MLLPYATHSLCLILEEAPQSVKSAKWFTYFDLAQGYLQLAMDEADIHSTAFHVQAHLVFTSSLICLSVSLIWCTSFCHLMEMCLGDQQYLTLLFYLDDICVFSSSIDEMLDRIELVLKRLQDFQSQD